MLTLLLRGAKALLKDERRLFREYGLDYMDAMKGLSLASRVILAESGSPDPVKLLELGMIRHNKFVASKMVGGTYALVAERLKNKGQ